MRSGITLAELLAAITIFSLLTSLAPNGLGGRLDRLAVLHASADVASAFTLARSAAISRGVFATVRIDSVAKDVRVSVGTESLLTRPLGQVYGVDVRSNRDSLAYSPIGHAYGAANQSIVIRRGNAADTVVVSRLGRVRYR
jgi:Tfp pilus assembly protein FimT